MVDIETLGLESNSVILSCAIIHFNIDLEFTYQELLDSAIFIKFSVKDQIQNYKRGTTRSTMDWWNTQPIEVKQKSFVPKPDDLLAVDGIQILRDYINSKDPKGKETVWERGSIDGNILSSLCRDIKQEDLFKFWMWREMRTAIDLLKDTASYGYCELPNFDKNIVVKHDPIHDCAYDIMQLKYGK